jgi:hypothetical protein
MGLSASADISDIYNKKWHVELKDNTLVLWDENESFGIWFSHKEAEKLYRSLETHLMILGVEL